MDMIKDRNDKEAEEIKKRWQKYTEELYKKGLNDPDNHYGVVTLLELDTLECEVKWALGSITMKKASGDDGIPAELLQILKDNAVKVLHSIFQQIWKNWAVVTGLEKISFQSNPKKGNAEECSKTIQLCSFHMLVRLCSKSFKLGFSSTWTENLQISSWVSNILTYSI